MLRNVLRGGAPVVVPTAIGTGAGLLVWGAASSLGIAALVAASTTAYTVLRVAGGAYLVVLGLSALRLAVRGEHGATVADAGGAGLTRWAAFRAAFTTNLLNPKIGIFYATLLPQFIPPGAPPLATSVLLAAIHAAENLVWLTLYGLVLARFGDMLRAGPLRRALEGLTGIVLVGLGLRVVIEVIDAG